MEKLGYLVLTVALVAWAVVIVVELVPIFPHGTIGLIALVGFGLLFSKVLKDRLEAAKNDKYSKDVER